MRIYQSKALLCNDADFASFTRLYGESVANNSTEPFLLVRDDDVRLMVVTVNSCIMLCLARSANDYCTSYASSYSDGSCSFRGLSKVRTAKDENFIDPGFAIKAIQAFFKHRSLSEYVDFRNGTPDRELLDFPNAIPSAKKVERQYVQLIAEVTDELQSDMQSVCEHLDDVANDPDENIDFDDAIQIGALCGGRVNRRKDVFDFSYHLANGDVWHFRVPRTILDGIADGSIKKLNVSATVKLSN